MIARLITASTRNPALVLILAALLAAAGLWAAKTTPLDAIPDLSDAQVIVSADFPGQSPQVVEDQVTYPLTTAMLAVPKAQTVRGYSFFGVSFVYVLFEEGTDLYWARSRVLEALSGAARKLPAEVAPTLGPDATGVGWVFEYALVDRNGQHDLADLRSIQDWYLRYPLQTVPGVAEVASIGGMVKQYQVEIDPERLAASGISLSKVRQAIVRSNSDVGGRTVEMGETEYMVRGLGYLHGVDDLAAVPLGVNPHGVPILLGQVAHIHLGPELRRGVAELNGEGEVAGGVAIVRLGENALAAIEGIKKKLTELTPGLPPGVEIVPVYDRSSLIERAVATLQTTLIEESIIVALVCLAFLLHLRSALVAVVTLPLGILAALLVMKLQGINANIMSLGGIAIAIGAMVDGAIVLIENGHKHLERAAEELARPLTQAERWSAIRSAGVEVGPALFFSLLIITVSFLPVLTLQAQEGRLFAPLAFTKTYAMAAAAILAVTVVPVLMGYLLRGNILPEARNPLSRALTALHTPILAGAIRYRVVVALAAALLLAASWIPLSRLGTEFMPPLDEGDILYMPTTFPGLSITKASELLQQTDRILHTFPEVASVFGKVGRADTATDPAPLTMLETTVRLKPKEQWPNPEESTAQLMRRMDAAIQYPGLANAWTMPIKTRIDMLATGIKTPVGIKISGPDLEVLQDLSLQVEEAIKTLPDTLSAFGDRTAGGYYLDIAIDRQAAARYGLAVDDIQSVIQTALGGMTVTSTVEGLARYPVNLRYPRDLRGDPDAIGRLLIATPSGAQIPLKLVATLDLHRGAPVIKSENARPNAWVYVDPATSDIGGYVARAQQAVVDQVQIPPGYTLIWSGQFEYMTRAKERLQLIVPVTLALIFLLLHLHFGNLRQPLLVMASIPFALVGGIWLLDLLHFNLSVAVGVGFIALAGVAAEIGVLVLTFIDQETASRSKALGRRLTGDEIWGAVQAGTAQRVRPIAMTALSTIAGLMPIFVGHGAGSEVMQRIAAPMVGGMISTLLLCLVVLPLLYGWVLQRWQPQEDKAP